MTDLQPSHADHYLRQCLNVNDLKNLAQKLLEPSAFSYFAGGAEDEAALARNLRALAEIALHYRVLRGVGERDMTTTLLDHRLSMPVIAAPTAFHQLAHPDGELATARAVKAEKSLFVLSTLSNKSVEEVAATKCPFWFQLYMYKDRGITRALLERVVASGCSGLVFTVDAPVLGKREGDERCGFRLPPDFSMDNLLPRDAESERRKLATSGLTRYFSELIEPNITWEDIRWLAGETGLPVMVKGIVRCDDAVTALDNGARGVIVSNHGGRQLDSAPATIDVLPRIAQVLAGRSNAAGQLPCLLVDGGIRRGSDVMKALAAGADAVLIGRPVLWGLAAGGEAGVRHTFAILRDELDRTLALCGCRSIMEITPDLFHA
ncbi:alpha-hydroxy acid oxidase [Acanthopleuribacter pedis]|uniref:Alpha-hydroxy-acid oxidizing protein n=1 Tax=Acanthopleuribacter pedis TaxID=442870 RepID=A0A8J7U3Z4_9BACT|nr:alpha-hydroxy acid oxidase [Acanthopleuribacter pedis]MBO1320958.1 alpha-hydroxy-acid oxidizing protein [Acanthopleuribacter pedis]